MNTHIFRTNINTRHDFLNVQSVLKKRFAIKDSTIDLEDHDKVLRVITSQSQPQVIADEVKKLDYFCEEMED